MTKVIAQDIAFRYKVIGLPSHICQPLAAEIEKWLHYSGMEWTVQRLKSLKADLLRIKSGSEPLTWVRKNRKGRWFGPIGSLFDWAMKDERKFSMSLQALMAYSLFTAPRLTPKQESKVINSIQAPSSFIPPQMSHDLRLLANQVVGNRSINWAEPRSLLMYQGSLSKKVPNLYGKSRPQDSDPSVEVSYLEEPWYWKLWNNFRCSFCFLLDGLPGAQNFERSCADNHCNNGLTYQTPIEPDEVIAGNLALLQEPGYKLRVVASPFLSYQLALKPLGNSLFRILKELPWDCTHDQSKAFPPIQRALGEGKTVHSIDLSSATDFFPLELQVNVLEGIFGEHEQINLFKLLSRARWRSPELGTITWTKGQPMGLYPSFASFGLAHGLLLLSLCGGIYQEQFYIVGDDVVIFSDDLRERYVRALDLLGCPISHDKSYSSNKFCEFAGKIVTTTAVIPMWKWRKMSDDNFLDLMRNLGEKAACFLTPQQRKVYTAVKDLLPPYGCNHSGGRSNLSTAVFKTEVFLENHVKKRQERVVELTSWLHRKYGYQGGMLSYVRKYDMERRIPTFDKKVVQSFTGTIFANLVGNEISFAKAVADFPELSPMKAILPLLSPQPGRLTTLDRYLKLLE